MGTVSSTIKKFPKPIRNLVYGIVPFRYRYNPVYRCTLKMLRKSARWEYEILSICQSYLLQQLLGHAYQNVPYYRKLFDKVGLSPSDIHDRRDLRYLPFLTKPMVREYWHDLQAINKRDEVVVFSTSGSTGAPFQFLGDKDLYAIEAAYITRAYEAHDTKLYREPMVWMRHYAPPKNGPLYYYDHELRRLYLSAFHLSEQNLDIYIKIMDKTKATTLSTYPSAAYILASLLRISGKSLRYIHKVHTASEQLLPQWRPIIESTIGPVYDHYGQMEKVSLFHQCKARRDCYHENSEYGITEILDNGDIIGTSLTNYAMPLIRYHTGDKAVPIHPSLCTCGSNLPLTVKEFEGRSDDILVTPEGRYIPAVNFYTMMYKLAGVGIFQIVQTSSKEINVQIVKDKAVRCLDSELAYSVKEGMKARVGDNMNILVDFVNEIKRDERTKKIRCVQRSFPLTLI